MVSRIWQYSSRTSWPREIECAHVVGHSVGGAVATRLALMHPATVDRLVLVAPAGLGKEFHPMVRLSSAPILAGCSTWPSGWDRPISPRRPSNYPAVITDELIELDYQMALQPGARSGFAAHPPWPLHAVRPEEEPVRRSRQSSRVHHKSRSGDLGTTGPGHTGRPRRRPQQRACRTCVCNSLTTAGICPCSSTQTPSTRCCSISWAVEQTTLKEP